MKTLFLIIPLVSAHLASATISCDSLLGENAGSALAVNAAKVSKMEEAQKAIISALNSQGDQTQSLLSFIRLLTKEPLDEGVRLLTRNSSLISKATDRESNITVKQVEELILQTKEELAKEGATSPKPRWNILGQKSSLADLKKRLEKAIQDLEKKNSEINEKTESLVSEGRKTSAAIRALEEDQKFLTDLYAWVLGVNDIESHNSLELHHFLLGLKDRMDLVKLQLNALKEQNDTLQTIVNESTSEVSAMDRFLNITLPIQRSAMSLSAPQTLPELKSHRNGTFRLAPNLLAISFRNFLSGDRIRRVEGRRDQVIYTRLIGRPNITVVSRVLEGYYYLPETKEGHDVNGTVTFEYSENKRRWLGIGKTENKKILREKIDLNKKSDMYRGLTNDIRAWYLIANPEMNFFGFKLDQVITFDPLHLDLDHARKVPDDFVLVGQILGSRIESTRYGNDKLVGVRFMFYDPQSRQVSGEFYGELREHHFKGARAYNDFRPQDQ